MPVHHEPTTPDALDRAYGLRPGTVAGWVRTEIIPGDLDGGRLEHAVVTAYLSEPCLAETNLASRAAYGEHRDEIHAAWAAAVRAALSRSPEDSPCPTTTVHSASGAA